MHLAELDDPCRSMAKNLLSALESQDPALIERDLAPLRAALTRRGRTGNRDAHASSSLDNERLDLMEGIAEALETSLAAIRRSTAAQLPRMRTAQTLLRHLYQTSPANQGLPASAQAGNRGH